MPETVLPDALPDTAADLPIVVTRHANLFAPAQWTDEHTTWGAFVAGVLTSGHRRDLLKESAPLLSLYELRPGGKRCNGDVQRVYGICLDFDDKPLTAVMAAAQRLQLDGCAVLAYTTWTHDPAAGRNRWRLIVPLAAPISGEQYPRALQQIWARHADHADRDADGVSRGFFVPSCQPHLADSAAMFYLPGGGLSLSTVATAAAVPLAPVPTPAAAAEPVRVLNTDTWRLLVRRWKRATSTPHAVDLGGRLERILEGVSFAEHGERDTSLWELLCAIAHAYPDVSGDSVWALFEHSIRRMQVETPPTTLTEHDVREKLERARAKTLSERDVQLPPDRCAAIRQAFGSSRETPYTAEELEQIQTTVGLSATELSHSWILQHESDYYVIGRAGALHLTGREALLNTVRVVLAPAPIELHAVDSKTGRRALTTQELCDRYSLPLTEVRRSLVEAAPVFELPARRITLPTCPLRPIAARYDSAIDEWLGLLAGAEDYPVLCQWLGHVPQLERPLTGLVLTGMKDVGKSMLAKGLSRLWCTSGPSKLTEAMGNFNATLERCPFCHADEADIPRDARGVERTGELREFVQATTRLINEKFRRQVPLDGAARLQISANNENVFSLNADLTDHDLGAIAERFTHIRCGAAAARYLAARGGRTGCAEWIEGDALPAHVLWLTEQYGDIWTGRFGVAQEAGLANTLAVRGGVRARACELFVRVLSATNPLGDGAMVLRRGRTGDFVVHLDWVLGNWETVLGRGRPSTAAIIQALEGLGERLEIDGKGYFLIRIERIEAWAAESGYGNATTVADWMTRHGV
jgi:hypothetical protein